MGIYNCEKTLKEAVDCLLKQTYSDWELIMCDDGSTDETFRIAQELQSTYPTKIRLLKNDKNRGFSDPFLHVLSFCTFVRNCDILTTDFNKRGYFYDSSSTNNHLYFFH
jgi:glycosyltransferase involved in cell wall biosynthesis